MRKHRARPRQHRGTRRESNREKGQFITRDRLGLAAHDDARAVGASHHAQCAIRNPLRYERGNLMPALRCAQEILKHPKHGGQSPRPRRKNPQCCHGVGASNHARVGLSSSMRRHYEGSKCHVLCTGDFASARPSMGLSPCVNCIKSLRISRGLGASDRARVCRSLPMRRH